jgi:valyl-tRNA synthetase
MITLYPIADEHHVDAEAERHMALLMDVAVAVRSIRAEYNVPQGDAVEVLVHAEGKAHETLVAHGAIVERAARCKLALVDALPEPPHSAKAVLQGVQLVVPLEGLIDLAAEKARLEREAGKVEKDIEQGRKKLANASFVERAPAEVVEKERERLADLEIRLERLRAAARRLS